MKSPSLSRKCLWSTSTVLALGVAILLVLMPGKLHATPVTLDVSADLQYGGTLTGTITFSSSSLTTITGYDIIASAGPGSPGFTFPGFTYTPSDSSITAESSILIQSDSDPAGEELRLNFGSALSPTGDTISTSSYESESAAGNRTVTSGSLSPAIAATPEPSSLFLLGTGLLGLGLLVRRQLTV